MSNAAEIIGQLHDVEDPADLRKIAEEAARLSQQKGLDRFREGMRVAFTPSKGKDSGTPLVGTVKRVNQKTVTVEDVVRRENETPTFGKYRIGPGSDWWDEVPAETSV